MKKISKENEETVVKERKNAKQRDINPSALCTWQSDKWEKMSQRLRKERPEQKVAPGLGS